MTYSPIAKGTTNWDVPLNAALAQIDSTVTGNNSNALQRANNLNDLTNLIQARNNLGISAGVVQGVNQFNVKDYGAVGNNVADDTAAIASAVSAANATGGIVYFPPGKYLINSGTGFSAGTSGVVIMGSGPEISSIVIGSGFTGTSLFSFTKDNSGVRDISIDGANQSSTTSNPVAHAVTVTGAGAFKVANTTFTRINGYCIRAIGTAANTLHGGMIYNVKMQSSAGGVYIISDNTATAANFLISNLFTRFMGVASGGSANLDCIHIEDSWDVLLQNCFTWMQATLGGTGASLRVKGNCAATFIQNLDALGPQTGNNVVIEDGPNGSPQNVQITGGVIQQGNVGLLITGGATQIRVSTMRIISNQTHGVSITGTGVAINIERSFFSLNGNGATGTNYDVNWSGTATGWITSTRFASPIVSTGTAGVQFSVNVAAGQAVKIRDAEFAGSGAAQANWVTAFPSVFSHAESGNYESFGNVNFSFSGAGRVQLAPSVTTNSVLSTNTNGTDAFDRFRLTGDGAIAIGPGTATRDTNLYRESAGVLKTDNNLSVAGNALGIIKPSNHGLVAWTFDPANVSTGKAGTAGTVYLAAVQVNQAMTATKILWGINTQGATITSGQNFVGLYNSAGSRLATVGVDARVTTTGMFTETISVAVTPGLYWVAFVFNATTMPQVYRGQDLNATLMNAGISSNALLRYATNGTSQTSLPSSITPSSNASAQFAYWAAIG